MYRPEHEEFPLRQRQPRPILRNKPVYLLWIDVSFSVPHDKLTKKNKSICQKRRLASLVIAALSYESTNAAHALGQLSVVIGSGCKKNSISKLTRYHYLAEVLLSTQVSIHQSLKMSQRYSNLEKSSTPYQSLFLWI
jgi:hypothetical protein